MNPEQYAAAEQLFEAALDLTPQQRTALLNAADVDDITRTEVMRWLEADASDSQSDVDQPIVDASISATQFQDMTMAAAGKRAAPTRVGRYVITETLGEGGMGVVYKARRDDDEQQIVALKLTGRRIATRSERARFRREYRLLSSIQHPGVATLHDASQDEDGHLYYAMEFVDGPDLMTFATAERLTIRQRVELVKSVCEGVRAIHEYLVIHRDLKPSNILVTKVDGRPMPKIIDFGIAKLTEGDLDDEVATIDGALMGTAAYCSPQAVDPARPILSTGADVYALGVILFQLLTGVHPSGRSLRDIRSMTAAELHAHHQAHSVLPPSRVLEQMCCDDSDAFEEFAAHCGRNAGRLLHDVDQDLDAIVGKALAHDVGARYKAAGELHDDLDAYLKNMPVSARVQTKRYQAARWIRRHRVPFWLSTAFAMFAIISIVVLSSALAQMTHAKNEAIYQVYLGRITVGSSLYDRREYESAALELDSCPVHLRGPEWHLLNNRIHSEIWRWDIELSQSLYDHVIDSSGRYACVTLADSDIAILDLHKRARIWTFPVTKNDHNVPTRGHAKLAAHPTKPVFAIGFAGSQLNIIDATNPGDIKTAQMGDKPEPSSTTMGVAFDTTGDSIGHIGKHTDLITGDFSYEISCWRFPDEHISPPNCAWTQSLHYAGLNGLSSLKWIPHLGQVVTSGDVSPLYILDSMTGAIIDEIEYPDSESYFPQEHHLAGQLVYQTAEHIHLWDPMQRTWSERRKLTGRFGRSTRDFFPETMLTLCDDNSIVRWHADQQQSIAIEHDATLHPLYVHPLPDGEHLLTLSTDAIRIYARRSHSHQLDTIYAPNNKSLLRFAISQAFPDTILALNNTHVGVWQPGLAHHDWHAIEGIQGACVTGPDSMVLYDGRNFLSSALHSQQDLQELLNHDIFDHGMPADCMHYHAALDTVVAATPSATSDSTALQSDIILLPCSGDVSPTIISVPYRINVSIPLSHGRIFFGAADFNDSFGVIMDISSKALTRYTIDDYSSSHNSVASDDSIYWVSDGALHSWAPNTPNRPSRTIIADMLMPQLMAVTPDQSRVCVINRSSSEFHLLDTMTGRTSGSFRFNSSMLLNMQFSRDGNWMYLSGLDGMLSRHRLTPLPTDAATVPFPSNRQY